MPFTRVGVDTQMAHVVKGKLAPDERVIAAMLTLRGPTPWLTKSFGMLALPFLVPLYITVTDRQVIVHRLSAYDNHVMSLAFVDPCAAVEITSVRRRPLWSSFRYRSLSVPQPIRINVHRRKRDLMDALVQHLSAFPERHSARAAGASDAVTRDPRRSAMDPYWTRPAVDGHREPDTAGQ
jgi:hypothetical protein